MRTTFIKQKCPYCKKIFKTLEVRQKYCSLSCSAKATNRKISDASKLNNKRLLKKFYITQKLSMAKVAKKFGAGETVIHKWLHRFQIPIRSRSTALTGYVKTPSHRRKIAENHKLWIGPLNPNYGKGDKLLGANNPRWKGGITGWQRKIRSSKIYRYWRASVLRRDNYVCTSCKKIRKHLHVHHIKSFADYKELRFKVSNGMTLCGPCHYQIHSRTRKRG